VFDNDSQKSFTAPLMVKVVILVCHYVISHSLHANSIIRHRPTAFLPTNQFHCNISFCFLSINLKKFVTFVTPLLRELHWLPVAAHIKFKALTFAYRTTTGFLTETLEWTIELLPSKMALVNVVAKILKANELN